METNLSRLDVEVQIGASFRRSIVFVTASTNEEWPIVNTVEIRVGGKISHEDSQYQWYASTLDTSGVDAIAKGTVEIVGDNAVLIDIPATETEKLSPHSGAWNLELDFGNGVVLRALSGRYVAVSEIIK